MRRSTIPLAALAFLTLAGCSVVGDYLKSNQTTPRIGPSGVAHPEGADRASDKIAKLPASAADLECPNVDVTEGGATARVGGEGSAAVRYQFDITNVARECDPQGAQFALKVGVEGKLLIGPAGAPGAYATTLHVVVKREADGKAVFTKSLNVAANTGGEAQASFRVVTDPILLPLTRARLDSDYSIEVGLGAGGGAPRARRPRNGG